MRTSRRTHVTAHRAAHHRAYEPDPAPGDAAIAAQRQAWFIRRFDQLVLMAVLLLVLAFCITFFVAGIDLNRLTP
jgi:hypothetical protein